MTIHQNLAGVGGQECGEHQEQGGLARTVRPHQRGDQAGWCVEVDPIDGDDGSERAPDAPHADPDTTSDVLRGAVHQPLYGLDHPRPHILE